MIHSKFSSESETVSRINFGAFGAENIKKVLGRWECLLFPRKTGKANVITKQVDVYLKSNETMQRNLMNIELQNLKVDENVSFRPSFCPDNSVCTNTDGSYVCNCLPGFRKVGSECQGKINYCLTHSSTTYS